MIEKDALRRYLCKASDALQGAAPTRDLEERVRALERLQEFREVAPKELLGQLQCYLRRSGFYHKAIKPDGIDTEKLVVELLRVFDAPVDMGVRRLAALSSVRFDEDCLEYPQFAIRKFSQEVLDTALENTINRAFYPAAVVDAASACDYWFLDVVGMRHGQRPAPRVIDRLVQRRYTPHESDLDAALRSLVLWDWGNEGDKPRTTSQEPTGRRLPSKLEIPFVLTVNLDLRIPPNPGPRIVELDWEIDEDDGNRYLLYDHNVQARLLDPFLERWDALLRRLSSDSNWTFLNLALSVMTSALFSNAQEELLWQLVAIEALIGEDSERGGLTGLLERRIEAIHDKATKKRFSELYKLRSKLVHGDIEYEKLKLTEHHIQDARILARTTALWFLKMAEFVEHQKLEPHHIPSRREILMLLDMNERTRVTLAQLLPKIAPTFPKWQM